MNSRQETAVIRLAKRKIASSRIWLVEQTLPLTPYGLARYARPTTCQMTPGR